MSFHDSLKIRYLYPVRYATLDLRLNSQSRSTQRRESPLNVISQNAETKTKESSRVADR